MVKEDYADMVYKIDRSNKEMAGINERNKALKEDLSKQITLFNEVSNNLTQHNEVINKLGSKSKSAEQDLEMKKKTKSTQGQALLRREESGH